MEANLHPLSSQPSVLGMEFQPLDDGEAPSAWLRPLPQLALEVQCRCCHPSVQRRTVLCSRLQDARTKDFKKQQQKVAGEGKESDGVQCHANYISSKGVVLIRRRLAVEN
jgi:hypothetical protein